MTFIVGPDAKPYHIHTNLIPSSPETQTRPTQWSKDFQPPTGPSKHHSTDKYPHSHDLTDIDIHVFEILVDILYNDHLDINHADGNRGLQTLIRAWRLAETLRLETCQNTLMDVICDFLSSPVKPSSDPFQICPRVINWMTGWRLPSGHPLRRLVTDVFAFQMEYFRKDHVEENGVLKAPHAELWKAGGELVVDIMTRRYNTASTDVVVDPARDAGCAYHVHTTMGINCNGGESKVPEVTCMLASSPTSAMTGGGHSRGSPFQDLASGCGNGNEYTKSRDPRTDKRRHARGGGGR